MYQIRKGWPSNGAIDEVFTAATNATSGELEELSEGMIVTVKDHKAAPAASADDSAALAFVIGHEQARKTWTGLLSQCVIECDADHYTGTFDAGDKVTVSNGKFAKAGSGATAIGRVLAYDAPMLRVLWYESK